MPKLPAPTNESLQDLVKDVESRERYKEEQRTNREEKRRQKEANRRQLMREKMVAPILLFLTILASVIVWFWP
jgi:hypothetical protein